jgi:hypothetical protein
LHLGRTFAQHLNGRAVAIELVANNLVGVGRVVKDGSILFGVRRERRSQLVRRDAIPFGPELVAELKKKKTCQMMSKMSCARIKSHIYHEYFYTLFKIKLSTV